MLFFKMALKNEVNAQYLAIDSSVYRKGRGFFLMVDLTTRIHIEIVNF